MFGLGVSRLQDCFCRVLRRSVSSGLVAEAKYVQMKPASDWQPKTIEDHLGNVGPYFITNY